MEAVIKKIYNYLFILILKIKKAGLSSQSIKGEYSTKEETLYSLQEGYALDFRRDYIKTAKEGKGRVIWCISTV